MDAGRRAAQRRSRLAWACAAIAVGSYSILLVEPNPPMISGQPAPAWAIATILFLVQVTVALFAWAWMECGSRAEAD